MMGISILGGHGSYRGCFENNRRGCMSSTERRHMGGGYDGCICIETARDMMGEDRWGIAV